MNSSQFNLRRISIWMRVLTVLMGVGLALGFVGGWWLFSEGEKVLFDSPNQMVVRENLQWWQYALAITVSAMPPLLLMWGLHGVYLMMQGFEQGQYFSSATIGLLKRFCTALLVSSVLSIVVMPVLSMVLSWNNPPNQRFLTLELHSTMYTSVFFAGVLWVISHIMQEGANLAAENAEFV